MTYSPVLLPSAFLLDPLFSHARVVVIRSRRGGRRGHVKGDSDVVDAGDVGVVGVGVGDGILRRVGLGDGDVSVGEGENDGEEVEGRRILLEG